MKTTATDQTYIAVSTNDATIEDPRYSLGIEVSAAAGNRAIVLVPETVTSQTHEWCDDFFDSSEHDIVAVFDHDRGAFDRTSKTFDEIMWCFLAFFVGFPLLIGLLTDWETGRFILFLMSPMTVICGLSTYWGRFAVLPHTAVTSHGLLHINKFQASYFVSLGDIVNISNNALSLAKNASCYQDGGGCTNLCSYVFGIDTVILEFLKDEAVFRQVILTLKKRQQEATAGDLLEEGDGLKRTHAMAAGADNEVCSSQ